MFRLLKKNLNFVKLTFKHTDSENGNVKTIIA